MKNKQVIANSLWTKFKKEIFETDVEQMKDLKRHVIMCLNPSKDYLTKLDLVDSNPELFLKNKMMNFTEQEIEHLRCHLVQGKKLFGSPRPRTHLLIKAKEEIDKTIEKKNKKKNLRLRTNATIES